MTFTRTLAALVAASAVAAPALADFSGQTILGPLTNGSSVTGDTSNATDDNDGFSSGDHFFFIWTGNDDVWQLDWSGGDMEIEMLYNPAQFDADLFLYGPSNYDDSTYYSILNTGVENISLGGAIAGTYYVVIDSDSGAGAYSLNVTPTPGSGAVLAIAGLAAFRRRR
ncbi:MAG: hypothetical protein R3B49_05940 [Phycisphaerales bacterium]